MIPLVLTLITLAFLTTGGLLVVQQLEQLARDRHRRTYRLAFPSDLDPERVTAWLRSLSGTLRVSPISKWLGGLPTVALEVWATNQGIEHRLKVPWQYEPYIRPKLESLIPGIRLTPEPDYPVRVWVHAVEAGLKAGHRPLRIPVSSDLSTSLLSNFSALGDGETLMLQWVVSPAVPEHKPIFGDAASKEQGWLSLLTGSVATRDEINDRRDKLVEPNMLAVLRVGAVADTSVRAQFLVRGVIATLEAARGPSHRLYKRLVSHNDLQRRITRASTPATLPVQLSAPELAAALAWPLGSPMVSGLPAAVSRYLPATETVPREGRVLGLSSFPGRERKIAMSYTEAFKHVHVLGGTGVGKTTLLANMARQDIQAGYGLVLIESKGDLFSQILDYIPPERMDDVIVMDVNDAFRPVGFNILQQGDRATVVDELIMVFNAMYPEHQSLWMQQVLNFGLSTLVLDKRATFIDLMPLLSATADELDWRDNLIRQVKDPQVKRFWREFEARSRTQQDQRTDPLMTRLWPLSRSKLVNILGQSESSFLMRDVVRDNKILLVNLSKVEQGSASLMGTLILNTLWQAVKREPSTKGTFLYLDEMHHYMNLPVDVEQMLVEARSMKLGMVLAHQYLDQLSGKNMREAVMSNARTKISFQLSADDAGAMAKNFGKFVSADDFLHLGQYETLSRISTGEGVSAPLTLNTLAPMRGTGQAGRVRYESRGRYGRPIAQVQDEILNRRNPDKVPRRARPKPFIEGWGQLG